MIAAEVRRATGQIPTGLPVSTPIKMPEPIHGPGVTMEQLDELPRVLDRSCMCRWPLGKTEDKPEFFCGAPSVVGRVYCKEHAAIAKLPVQSFDLKREMASITFAQRRTPYASIIDRVMD